MIFTLRKAIFLAVLALFGSIPIRIAVTPAIITLGNGEMISLAALVLTVLGMVIGSYTGIQKLLSRHGAQLDSVIKTNEMLQAELNFSRRRYHELSSFVTEMALRQGLRPFVPQERLE